MQKQQIPQYKPSPELQKLLQEQQEQFQTQQQHIQDQQRKRTAVLPKRNWIQRNPRVFQITFITVSLLAFFSKPIYDAFIATPVPGKSLPAHKR